LPDQSDACLSALTIGRSTGVCGKGRNAIASTPDTGNGTPPIVDMGAYEAAETTIYLPLIRR
jgi:hypothetical protein